MDRLSTPLRGASGEEIKEFKSGLWVRDNERLLLVKLATFEKFGKALGIRETLAKAVCKRLGIKLRSGLLNLLKSENIIVVRLVIIEYHGGL